MARHLAVVLLVVLFMYASFGKIFDLKDYVDSMYNQPLPHWLVAPMVIFLPVAEVATALGLIFEKTQRRSLQSALGLLSLFSLYIACILLHFFRWVPCSCGAIFHKLTWGQHLLINLLLAALTAMALTRRSKDPVPLYPS